MLRSRFRQNSHAQADFVTCKIPRTCICSLSDATLCQWLEKAWSPVPEANYVHALRRRKENQCKCVFFSPNVCERSERTLAGTNMMQCTLSFDSKWRNLWCWGGESSRRLCTTTGPTSWGLRVPSRPSTEDCRFGCLSVVGSETSVTFMKRI